MSDVENDYQRTLAEIPHFFAQVAQSFAYLDEQYSYRLHAQRADSLDHVQDARASMDYVGQKAEVRVWWSLSDATMGVTFNELKYSRLSAANGSVSWGRHVSHPDTVRAIDLWELADYLGHGDDPDFCAVTRSPGRSRISPISFNERLASSRERTAMIHDELAGVLDGLARLIERYGKKVLKSGNPKVFAAVWDRYDQYMREQNAPAVPGE
jgi:hypothetical protein